MLHPLYASHLGSRFEAWIQKPLSLQTNSRNTFGTIPINGFLFILNAADSKNVLDTKLGRKLSTRSYCLHDTICKKVVLTVNELEHDVKNFETCLLSTATCDACGFTHRGVTQVDRTRTYFSQSPPREQGRSEHYSNSFQQCCGRNI